MAESSTERQWRDYDFTREVTLEQVAATLRDQDGPATSTEVAKGLNYVHFRTCDGEHGTPSDRGIKQHYSGGIDLIGYRGMMGSHVSGYLAILARRGVAAREKVGRSVMWRWVGEPVDMTTIEHLDFKAPSEVDLAIEELVEAGVEVTWTDQPIKSVDGGMFAGLIHRRTNGPLVCFDVELWTDAEAEKTLRALHLAQSVVGEPDDWFDRDGGLCLGVLRKPRR